jgi:putative glutamine amidotransferase
MAAKPVVGISIDCPFDRFAQSGFSDLLLPRWLSYVDRAGAVPVCIPPLRREADVTRVLDRLHGFVYAGCWDLEPQSEAIGPDTMESAPAVMLIRMIAERRLPLLGIGAGIQLLNVALGGTLRSVAQQRRDAIPHIHPHNPRHPLQVTAGTLLHDILPGETTLVSSSHAAVVDEIAVGLRVSARSPDGLVEAIESETGDWSAVGVQFLPDPHAGDLDDRLFETFVRNVRQAPLQVV